MTFIFLEIKDTYIGREDCLISVFVSFGIPDKKFGPAGDDEATSARKILTITERFSLPEGEDPKKSIAERIFDLEDESIKLKFHREKDRILSQVINALCYKVCWITYKKSDLPHDCNTVIQKQYYLFQPQDQGVCFY